MMNEIKYCKENKELNKRLYDILTEVEKAVDNAVKNKCQRDIDLFNMCDEYITIMIYSYIHVGIEAGRFLMMGDIYRLAWCYTHGHLNIGSAETLGEQLNQIMREIKEVKQQAEDHERKAGEWHNSEEALITTLLDKGNPFDAERIYVDIKTIADVLHEEAERAKNTFATRVGEVLNDVRPRYLKSKVAGKPAGFYHVPLVVKRLKKHFNIEEKVAYDALIQSERCVKFEELE